jgi:hypothetical protein
MRMSESALESACEEMLLPCLPRQYQGARIALERPVSEDGVGGAASPKIRPALKHYKLEGFSVERLMHFATALEHDVVIEIRPRARAAKKGRILIMDGGQRLGSCRG